MIYLTTFGMKDQLRDVVYSCIKDHIRNEGGINVTMVSGDHLETAKAVALKAGILDEDDMSHQYSVMTAD
jgi:P-type E1-E2 ATPase